MPDRNQNQISKSHKIQYQWLLSQGIEISRTPSCPRALVAESHVQAFKQELIRLLKQKAIQLVEIEKKKKKEDAVSNGEGSASR